MIPSSFCWEAMIRRFSELLAQRWVIWPSIVSVVLNVFHITPTTSNTNEFFLGRIIADNKLLIVKLGGLEPLIRQMLSPNVEVQCNAVGCVTNLATHGELLDVILPSKSLIITIRLSRRQQDEDREVGGTCATD